MSLIKDCIEIIQRKSNPISYWRKRGAQIGVGCDINSSLRIISEPYLVKIGDDVRISANTQIITHDGGVWVCRKLFNQQDIDLLGSVVIGNNVHIGTNVIIMPSVKIGDNCIIGCGSIITKDIPDNSVVAGVPAKVIKSIDEYYAKNKDNFLHTKQMTYEEKKNYIKSREIL